MTIHSVRYPAYPLVVHDPYFSIWSRSDRLTDSYPCHWTGENQTIAGLIRIDGKAFCFLSKVPEAPALKQRSVRVLPTRTIYTFEEAGIRFTLTFLTPALPYRLKVLARPITYVCFDAESMDGTQYAEFIELGSGAAHGRPGGRVGTWRYKDRHGNWHTTDGMDADPFIEPAVDANIGKLGDAVKRVLYDVAKYRGKVTKI